MSHLIGKKISLRAIEPADASLIFEWENNEQNWQLSNTLSPFSFHTIQLYIETAHHDIFENKQLRLMIVETESGKTVGSIDLFDFDPYHLRAGVGILINDTIDRRKGLASEALDLLKVYTKEVLALKQLFCTISENNKKSIALFEAKGFVQNGVQKQWQRVSSEIWEDLRFYQLLF